MDYQFIRDPISGYSIRISQEHEIIATWITEELGTNKQTVADFYHTLKSLENTMTHDFMLKGREISLSVLDYDVTIKANSLYHDNHELAQYEEDHLSLDTSTLEGGCGLEDFIQVIQGWLDFIR